MLASCAASLGRRGANAARQLSSARSLPLLPPRSCAPRSGWLVGTPVSRAFSAAPINDASGESPHPGYSGALPQNTEHHFRDTSNEGSYVLPHPVWTKEELQGVEVTHTPPVGVAEHLAYYLMKSLKVGFDVASGFKWGVHDEKAWLTRIIFLETVAGVPGMVAAGVRHLKSLRRMKRDMGWIHTLMEDAENERMHLLTALELRQPGKLFRATVIGAQGAFVTFFFVSYLLSPRFCHRFVAYLEETAVQTYTQCLDELDAGTLPMWSRLQAPEIAVKYWRLEPNATMRDVIENIRADEMHHREIHHTFADLTRDGGGSNPFRPGVAHTRDAR